MRDCALCGTEIQTMDEPVQVVVAITASGVLQGEAHPWCARAQREANAAAKAS